MHTESDGRCRFRGSLAAWPAWLLLLVFVFLCGLDVTILRAQTSSAH